MSFVILKYIIFTVLFHHFILLYIASAPPRDVEVLNFTDTAITVHWEPLECIDINSQFEITGYAVRYRFASEPDTSTEILSSLSIVTINILIPGVEYFIQVAAVNSNGEIGQFSDHITQTTSGYLACLDLF